MNCITVKGSFNKKEDSWEGILPNGDTWGGYPTFRELVQAVGENVNNEFQVTITHPDQTIGRVIILRGWHPEP